jgi:hypothetical protein
MKIAVVAVTLIVIAIGSTFAARIYVRHHNLLETLDWMARTYNPRPDGFGGQGIVTIECKANCADNPTIVMTETFSHRGCELTTMSKSNRAGDKGLRETFNLRNIDPDSIEIKDKLKSLEDDEGFTVAFKARNDVEGLSYSGNIKGAGNRSGFQVEDRAYGVRFAKAFKHAVELCGGRPSEF